MQWARASVSDGFPMSFFDNPEVREAVLMTVECGQNYIRTKPGGVKEPTLSHHTFFTTKLIPKLDKLIDDKNMGKMREMTLDLTEVVFNDGWTSVPWDISDIEMTVEESVSDDDDGPPHKVSDSESESESEQDCD